MSPSQMARWIPPVAAILMMASPAATLPGDALGMRRFQTPPVSPSLRLGQTFRLPVNGLHAIELFPAAAREGVSGELRLDLYEVAPRNSAAPVRSATVRAADLVAGPSYRFDFAPIGDSKDRNYRLDIVSLQGEGPAFWATKGERYDLGAMHANGRERWADLAFTVYAPTASVWGRLMALRETNPVRAYVVIAAAVAFWFALGLVVRVIETTPA